MWSRRTSLYQPSRREGQSEGEDEALGRRLGAARFRRDQLGPSGFDARRAVGFGRRG